MKYFCLVCLLLFWVGSTKTVPIEEPESDALILSNTVIGPEAKSDYSEPKTNF